MYYEFTQNNSGGSFVNNKKLCHRLFIEARTQQKATEKAILMGVYFDGCAEGIDCDCCGDRWSEPEEINIPYRYGTFEKNEAEKIAEKYKTDFGKTTWGFLGGKPNSNEYDVIFRTIESYAQYLADKFNIYSHKNNQVECRIFKKDGSIVEIKPKA